MRVLFDAIEQSFEINNTYGVVEDIYSGEGSDFIKCLECGYRSDRATKFYDLQLPIRNEFENVSDHLKLISFRSVTILLRKPFLDTSNLKSLKERMHINVLAATNLLEHRKVPG
jgi:hypothetical protein